MTRRTKNRRGFTLIEMLAIIAIISIISGSLIVNWRKNEKKYEVQYTAQGIVQNLRRAQDMALSGKKYPGEDVPPAYGIYFELSTKNSYLIFGDKTGNNTYQKGSDTLVETISLDSNIEIYSLSASKDLNIVFSITPSAPATIGIRKTGYSCPSNFCKSIIIKNTGEISIQ